MGSAADDARRAMATVTGPRLWAFRAGQRARADGVTACPLGPEAERLAWFKGWANPGPEGATLVAAPVRDAMEHARMSGATTAAGRRAALAVAGIMATTLILAACDNKKAAQAKPSPAYVQAEAMGMIRRIGAWGASSTTPATPTAGEEAPLADNYYFVFDGSGSMGEAGCSGGARGGRIVPAQREVVEFSRRLPPTANLGLFAFDRNGEGERVPLGHGPANRAAFENAVNRIEAGGNTPLGAAIGTGQRALATQATMQRGYGTYHMVVTTDGLASDPTAMDQAVAATYATPIVLETIGFCISGGHPLNQPGRTIYRDASDPASLRQGLAAVLAEGTTAGDDMPPANK